MGQSPETPHQIDLFTGTLVDNRTPSQKRNDRQRQKPKQDFLFSQRDMAQFGVNPKPLFSLSPNTSFVLLREDPRTDVEKARDLQQEAEARNTRLFEQPNEDEGFSPEAFIKAWVNELSHAPDNSVAWIVLAGLVVDTNIVDNHVQQKSTATAYLVKQTPQGHKLRQPTINSIPLRRNQKYKVRRPKQKHRLKVSLEKKRLNEGAFLAAEGGYVAYD